MSDLKKLSFFTYNEKIAIYLLQRGVKVTALYTADDITCYKVYLRGRKQCRILEEKEFQEYNSGTEAYLVAYKRIAPPVQTLKTNGEYALLQDATGGPPYLALTRQPELLTKVNGETEVVTLNTWEEVKGFLDDAKNLQHGHVKFFVGYGPNSRAVPYRETHDIRTLETVVVGQIAAAAAPKKEEGANDE